VIMTTGNIGTTRTFLDQVTISPDGQQVAYVDSSGVVIAGANSTNLASIQPTALVWGPTAWRVRSN
jgi:hypothetical protein